MLRLIIDGSIRLCFCQALANTLRRQLYQASVSKHFLSSTIVSGFGDCIWDGSPDGTVPGWSFLQSLLHTLSLYFQVVAIINKAAIKIEEHVSLFYVGPSFAQEWYSLI